MGEEIAIAGGEDETGAELKGVLAESMLVVAGGASTSAGSGIVAAENVEEIAGFQLGGLIGDAVGVHK